MAVVFERGEGEIVLGDKVLDGGDDALEGGELADQDNAGCPEVVAGVFAAHAPPLVEDGPHASERVQRSAPAAPPERHTST
jgi:hypothetical protein